MRKPSIELQIVDKTRGSLIDFAYFNFRRIGPDRDTGRTTLVLNTEQAVALRNELNDLINTQLKGRR